MFYYTDYGWLTTSVNTDRSTNVQPPAEDAVKKANWTGSGWVLAAYTAPPPATAPMVSEWYWLIDIGPFFDRFGAAKMAVLTSTDATVNAIVRDVSVRKWVDLKRPDVAQGLAYIGSKVPSLTTAMQQSIISIVPTEADNLALRKLFFA